MTSLIDPQAKDHSSYDRSGSSTRSKFQFLFFMHSPELKGVELKTLSKKKETLLYKLLLQIIYMITDPTKSISIVEIRQKLDQLIAEKIFKKKHHFRFSQLTPREKEVLMLLARGHSNKTIASRLLISLETVKHYRKIIKSKLEVCSTADFIRYAQAFNLYQAFY